MSEVIELLNKLGSDASLQNDHSMEILVSDSNLKDEIKTSLLEKDIHMLEQELDISSDIICFVLPAEDDESEEESTEEQKQSVVNG